MVTYVFWDSDNTLIHTAAHHWRKHFETLKSLGIHLGDEWQKRIYENNGAQNWEWLTHELGLSIPLQDYLDRIDAWYFDHIDDIEIRKGVIEALHHFQTLGIPQAVVSNGRRRSVMAALEAKKLVPFFTFILCKEDYEGRKPDPTPYQTALKRMEDLKKLTITPAECLVIEDDPLGVESAEKAGMQVIFRPLGKDFDITTNN